MLDTNNMLDAYQRFGACEAYKGVHSCVYICAKHSVSNGDLTALVM